MTDPFVEACKNDECKKCPFCKENNGHDISCADIGYGCLTKRTGYINGKFAFHEGKLVEVIEDGKVVYSKEEIWEMLDKGESITDIILDPSLKDLSWLFSNREDFNQDISNWDVSNITNMYGMFYGATSFNQDISKWDVSNVTDMGLMFHKATSFNQDVSKWDVSRVKDMRGMFEGATSFNQDLSNWDVSNAECKDYMFEDSGYTFPKPKC